MNKTEYLSGITYSGFDTANVKPNLVPDAEQGAILLQLNLLKPGASIKGITIVGKKMAHEPEITQDISGSLHTFFIPFNEITSGHYTITVEGKDIADNSNSRASVDFNYVGELVTSTAGEDAIRVKLERGAFTDTSDEVFWTDILKHSLDFKEYQRFIDSVLYDKAGVAYPERPFDIRRSPFIASDEYNVIKFATEAYMLRTLKLDTQSIRSYLGTSRHLPYFDYVMERLISTHIEDKEARIDKEKVIPHIKGAAATTQGQKYKAPASMGNIDDWQAQQLDHPFMIELIWNYWMEQGMLVQTMNMVNLRFQNIKVHRGLDPLMRFDAGPLRPLSHILWGYIQDEQHRLSLTRRVYEYDHEYGLTLTGRAVGRVQGVDTRVKFLEAFHNLLNSCILFYREYDNTTIVADGFPILNNLREVHLLLAEGNHNAYGDLTWTARHEMLVQQYILARNEMREFLGGRVMVPYPEKWMDRVDMMRNLQGWGGNDILSYYELAVHGEKVLLSIRYGNWSQVSLTQDDASNWAVAFRNNIQRYVHAYRVVTGVDLSAARLQEVRDYATQPAFLIQERFGRKDMPAVRPKMYTRQRNY